MVGSHKSHAQQSSLRSSCGKQDALAGLRKWQLERDDTSDPGGRLYWDESGRKYFSVTRILAETSPQEQRQALERWLAKPGAEQERSMAANRGSQAHAHLEYCVKTGARLARASANKRGCWKQCSDGLERCPAAITKWALHKAVENAPSASWSSSGYARGLRSWALERVTQVHACEFSVFASLRPRTDGTYEPLSPAQARESALAGDRVLSFAGSCDGLFDVDKQLCLVDWKTTGASRHQSGAMKEARLLNYRDQLGGYSLGLRHLTGIEAPGAAIVVGRRTGAPEVTFLGAAELKEAEKRFLERVERFMAARAR